MNPIKDTFALSSFIATDYVILVRGEYFAKTRTLRAPFTKLANIFYMSLGNSKFHLLKAI